MNVVMEDEETLKTFEEDCNIRSFSLSREVLDKAHKDTRCKVFIPEFKVCTVLLNMPCLNFTSLFFLE